MARPKLSEMTLREKIGQTGMPGPGEVRSGVKTHGGYAQYFTAYPFCGLYLDETIRDANGETFPTPKAVATAFADASNALKVPLFVSCDFELGAKQMFAEFHRISSNMSVGAARSGELAYQRGYWWAKEMKAMGVNWPFGPVGDLLGSFFCSTGVRCLTDSTEIALDVYGQMVKGIQDAGVAATAKHFPSGEQDYRDPHFCDTEINATLEEWNIRMKPVWKSAIDAGVLSFMVGHQIFPAVDDSYARANAPRPCTASKKVLDLLREDLQFDGVVITDAVSMKALSAAFDHEDIYIECFNAGNDIVLFVHDDYIDIMEQAVRDGRVSEERIDRSVERILDLKEKLGLFDGVIAPAESLTGAEQQCFEEVNYGIARKALTLVRNQSGALPFCAAKIKNVTILCISQDPAFLDDVKFLKKAFEDRGIRVQTLERLKSKEELKTLTQTEDLIIYACFIPNKFPQGMLFYSTAENLLTLFNALSYGAEKTVVASFSTPSIYHNYFQNADMFINTYSSDDGTMKAFVDGILGDFVFTGKSPVALKPEVC